MLQIEAALERFFGHGRVKYVAHCEILPFCCLL